LDPETLDFLDLARDDFEYVRIDAETRFSRERLTGKLEEDPLISALRGL